jgi:hypothetical protein
MLTFPQLPLCKHRISGYEGLRQYSGVYFLQTLQGMWFARRGVHG